MKKYLFATGTLMLAIGILPAAVTHAENGSAYGATNANVNLNVTAQTQGATDASTSASVSAGENQQGSGTASGGRQERRHSRSLHAHGNATSSRRALERAYHMSERAREALQGNILGLALESTTSEAFSFTQLERLIEHRQHVLELEASSTATADQNIVRHINQVRLAVAALLAAKPLLGGIGQQVSDIAQQIDASVGTTTTAEVNIKARGFWTNFLFGGDTAAAAIINNEVAQNEQHIQDLTQLLSQANLSVDVQTTLKAQIAAMQLEQTRLTNLAQQEQSQWGLFSWRF